MCNGKRCEQTCTRGGCGMKCHGQICEQRCTRGNCQLACPRNAMKCQQTCEINRDKCERFVALAGTTAPTAAAVTDAPTTAVTTVAVPTTAPAECNRVRNRTCYQYCTRGGCTMECQKSPYYDSCVQSCTGRQSRFYFPFWVIAWPIHGKRQIAKVAFVWAAIFADWIRMLVKVILVVIKQLKQNIAKNAQQQF